MSDPPESQAQEPVEAQVHMPPEQMAGVWANFAQVGHSPYEFTLDFIRMDFSRPQAPQGIVVARVSVSPLFISQLMEALDKNWKLYAEKALPQEARDYVSGPDDQDDTQSG